MHELNWSCCYNDPTPMMNFSGYATDYVDYLQIMLATKKFTTSYTVNSNHYTVNIRSIIRMPIDRFIYIITYINLVFITYDTNQIFSTNNGVTLLPFPQVYQITIKIDRVLKSFYISFILTHRTYQHYLAQCC